MEDLIHLHNGEGTEIFGNNEKYSPLLDIKLIFFFSPGRTLLPPLCICLYSVCVVSIFRIVNETSTEANRILISYSVQRLE
jgi:hypothetical protein